MSGDAETPNIAGLPADAQLRPVNRAGSRRQSARKVINPICEEGSLSCAYFQTAPQDRPATGLLSSVAPLHSAVSTRRRCGRKCGFVIRDLARPTARRRSFLCPMSE